MALKKNVLGQFVRNDSDASGEPAAPPQRLLVDERGRPRYYRHKVKRVAMVKHFRVDEVLKPEDREAYEKLLNDPSSTNATLHAWLSQRSAGTVCQGAVGAHRRDFLIRLNGINEASKKAQAFLGVIRRAGAANMSDAVQGRYEQLFMESLFEMKPGGSLTPKDWKELSQVMKTIVTTRQDAEQRNDPPVENASTGRRRPPHPRRKTGPPAEGDRRRPGPGRTNAKDPGPRPPASMGAPRADDTAGD